MENDINDPKGKEIGDLRFAIDDVWRSIRNEVILGLDKSEMGLQTMPVEEFNELSRYAVRKGENITREVQY